MSIDIQALKATHRLEDLVAEQVVLVPDGIGRLKGLCPFHAERTPSFFVYVDQQTYHCFGASCQAHGDIIAYVQRRYDWTFTKAVEYLLARAPGATPLRPPPRSPTTEVDAQLAALHVATAIYHRDITSRWSPQARHWLAGRGLLPDRSLHLIDACHLGYCTGARGPDIIAELRRRQIPIEAARDIGILGRQGTYEPFAGRLIIPEIRQGVVVWLTGRLVNAAPAPPDHPNPRKYLNVRGPRRLLGAARILHQREVIVVESPLDFLTLTLWDFPTCAMEGGSIPQGDLALFVGTDKVFLPHNRDEAGWGATQRLAAHFRDRAYSIFLPSQIYQQSIKDVSDMAAKSRNTYLGAQLFRECGKQAVPYDPELWSGAYS